MEQWGVPEVDRSGLEPALAAFLDEEEARAGPPLECLRPDEARSAVNTAMRRWWGPVEPVGRVEDVGLPGAGPPVRARVYWPGTGGPHPGVVFFHGGGWVLGDLDTHDGPCRRLCNQARAVVVSVEYRKAPENPFPAGLDDAWRGLRWVGGSADALGILRERVVVAGDSAGANLATVVARRARGAGFALSAQVLVYPVADCDFGTGSYTRFGQGFGLTTTHMRWFFDHYAPAAKRHLAGISPLRAGDLSGLPPTYLVTCGFDPLADEGGAYAQRIRAAGVVVV
ncbi:MAG: alpha/beta hydrolase, partial [Acidimicrobiales bacterium]